MLPDPGGPCSASATSRSSPSPRVFTRGRRTELGKAGRDNRGIFRVHQFEKVEQFCITAADPDLSKKMRPGRKDSFAFPCIDFCLPDLLILPMSGIPRPSQALGDATPRRGVLPNSWDFLPTLGQRRTPAAGLHASLECSVLTGAPELSCSTCICCAVCTGVLMMPQGVVNIISGELNDAARGSVC